MLDHRLESLEGRSLLSTTLPSGMPAVDAGHGGGATVVDDTDMYSFHRGVDDAVYEQADPTEDGGDHGEWDGGAFDDTVQYDLSADGTTEDESHPWVGLGAEADSADDTQTIDDGEDDDSAESDMAQAVTAAHDPSDTVSWIDTADTGEDDGLDVPDVTDTTGTHVSVQFSFDGGSAMPSYRDLAL